MYIPINFSSIPCIFLFACSWVKIQPEQAFQVNSKSFSAADAMGKELLHRDADMYVQKYK